MSVQRDQTHATVGLAHKGKKYASLCVGVTFDLVAVPSWLKRAKQQRAKGSPEGGMASRKHQGGYLKPVMGGRVS